jgi:hypothetical protein
MHRKSLFPEGFARIRKPPALIYHDRSYALSKLAIFARDFGRLHPRLHLPGWAYRDLP